MLFIAGGQSDDVLRKAGHFVHLLFDREAGPQIVKLHGASGFGEDREGERIPFGENLAVGDVFAVHDAETGAVHDVVALLLAVLFVHDGDEASAVHGDGSAAAALDELEVHELDDTVVARFERGTLGNAGGGSADVERTHGQLGAGFADGLRGDDADRFAQLNHAPGGEVAAVAESANSAAGFAGEHGTDADAFDTRGLHLIGKLFGDFLVHVHDDRALEVLDLVEGDAAHDAVAQRLDFDAGFDDGLDVNAVGGAAIALVDDDVLRHVHETSSEVTGVGGLKSRVGQAFTRTVRGDEVLQHGKALAEVGSDGRFDDFAGGLGHQTAHTGKLADLLFRTASAGVRHNVDGVDVALFVLVFEGFEHFVGDAFGDVAPDGDDFVVALAVGDGAVEVLLLDLDDFLFGVFHQLVFVAGDEHVIDADGDARLGGVGEPELLQMIEKDNGVFQAKAQVGVIDELLDALLLEQTVDEREFLRQVRIEDDAANSSLNELALHLDGHGVRHVLIVVRGGEVDDFTGIAQTDGSEQLDFAGFESENDFVGGAEDAAFALGAGLGLSQVVDAQHHVLRRNGQRQAVRGRQDVARAKHEHGGFHLRFRRKRNMHGHLVAVKVGVECGADERVNADGLAFHEHRFERLNAETVQRRSAVEHHGMFADDVFENVPDDRFLLLDHFLGLLDGGAVALGFELVIDEGLEKLERHFLGQPALMQLQLGSDDDDGTAGIVHALAEQVLAETALFALERIAERLERAVVCSAENAAAAAVVEQRVDGFLEHALFVADDDVRRAQFHELFQPVVAVDDAAIEVIQVGSGEASAVQRHKRAQFRRKNRDHVQNHPLRLVAALAESLKNLQALGKFDPLLQRRISLHLFAKFVGELFHFHAAEQFLDGFGAHLGGELAGIFLLQFAVLVFEQHFALAKNGDFAGIDDDERLKVKDALKIAHGNVQQVADAAGQTLEEPHMRAGRSQLDVPER